MYVRATVLYYTCYNLKVKCNKYNMYKKQKNWYIGEGW